MPAAPDKQASQLDALLTRLRSDFPTLSPQFQAATRYILDHPEEISISSMRTIAAQANVQPPTLVRLAQFLGFEGWQGLRDVFLEAVRRGPKRYATRAKQVVRPNGAHTIQADMLDAQQHNLALLRDIDPDMIAKAADLLSKADNVHIAGFRASFPIAFSLHYVYRLFRPSVYLIRGDAGALELELRVLTDRDVLFAVSFAPYSQQIIQVIDAARAAGCKIVALTDSTVSPLALQADCTLLFSVESPSFFPSIAAGVAAVETLVTQLLVKEGRGAIKALETSEGQLHKTGAYLPSR